MDGYQVAEELRRRWSSDRLKLIAVTGYGGDADLHRGRRVGFDHYLIKPLDLGTLEKALASHHATRVTSPPIAPPSFRSCRVLASRP